MQVSPSPRDYRNLLHDRSSTPGVVFLGVKNFAPGSGLFDQELAPDHLLTIIRDQRAGYHNLDAKTRGVAEEGLMRIVVGEPSR